MAPRKQFHQCTWFSINLSMAKLRWEKGGWGEQRHAVAAVCSSPKLLPSPVRDVPMTELKSFSLSLRLGENHEVSLPAKTIWDIIKSLAEIHSLVATGNCSRLSPKLLCCTHCMTSSFAIIWVKRQDIYLVILPWAISLHKVRVETSFLVSGREKLAMLSRIADDAGFFLHSVTPWAKLLSLESLCEHLLTKNSIQEVSFHVSPFVTCTTPKIGSFCIQFTE